MPRILVVEDDGDVRTLVTTVLSKDYEVMAVEDGLAALMAIETGYQPDLAIVDVMMPNLDGISLTKALHGHKGTTNLPVIMLTAKSSARDVVEGINAGAKYYLTKPFKMDELLSKVKKLVGSGR